MRFRALAPDRDLISVADDGMVPLPPRHVVLSAAPVPPQVPLFRGLSAAARNVQKLSQIRQVSVASHSS